MQVKGTTTSGVDGTSRVQQRTSTWNDTPKNATPINATPTVVSTPTTPTTPTYTSTVSSSGSSGGSASVPTVQYTVPKTSTKATEYTGIGSKDYNTQLLNSLKNIVSNSQQDKKESVNKDGIVINPDGSYYYSGSNRKVTSVNDLLEAQDKGIGRFVTDTHYDFGNQNTETPTSQVSGTSSANSSYYDELMKAFMQQNDAARQSMIDAIMKNLEAVKGEYKNQIQKVIDEYQTLINSNEVNRERTRRRIREDQANRGQLDSGLGRQERLNLDTTYDSNQSQLTSARESAVQEIMNLIAQAEAEANSNKASVDQQYANALLQFQLANS